MPPKKATEDVKDNVVAFGRVRKNLKMGCVGLPNVGKSSLFNLLTEQSAAAENYPFCTIEPNEARCPVPDARYVCSPLLPEDELVTYVGFLRVNCAIAEAEADPDVDSGFFVWPMEAAVHVSGFSSGDRHCRAYSWCFQGRGLG